MRRFVGSIGMTGLLALCGWGCAPPIASSGSDGEGGTDSATTGEDIGDTESEDASSDESSTGEDEPELLPPPPGTRMLMSRRMNASTLEEPERSELEIVVVDYVDGELADEVPLTSRVDVDSSWADVEVLADPTGRYAFVSIGAATDSPPSSTLYRLPDWGESEPQAIWTSDERYVAVRFWADEGRVLVSAPGGHGLLTIDGDEVETEAFGDDGLAAALDEDLTAIRSSAGLTIYDGLRNGNLEGRLIEGSDQPSALLGESSILLLRDRSLLWKVRGEDGLAYASLADDTVSAQLVPNTARDNEAARLVASPAGDAVAYVTETYDLPQLSWVTYVPLTSNGPSAVQATPRSAGANFGFSGDGSSLLMLTTSDVVDASAYTLDLAGGTDAEPVRHEAPAGLDYAIAVLTCPGMDGWIVDGRFSEEERAILWAHIEGDALVFETLLDAQLGREDSFVCREGTAYFTASDLLHALDLETMEPRVLANPADSPLGTFALVPDGSAVVYRERQGSEVKLLDLATDTSIVVGTGSLVIDPVGLPPSPQ